MEDKGDIMHQFHQETDQMIREDGVEISFGKIKRPDIITITSEGGDRVIMRIDADGNYHGDLADASEAAAVFCLDVQERLREFAAQNRILLVESAKR